MPQLRPGAASLINSSTALPPRGEQEIPEWPLDPPAFPSLLTVKADAQHLIRPHALPRPSRRAGSRTRRSGCLTCWGWRHPRNRRGSAARSCGTCLTATSTLEQLCTASFTKVVVLAVVILVSALTYSCGPVCDPWSNMHVFCTSLMGPLSSCNPSKIVTAGICGGACVNSVTGSEDVGVGVGAGTPVMPTLLAWPA